MTDVANPRAPNPWAKLAIELGPLLVFFFANARFGIFAATAAFMAAITVSLGLSWWLVRKVPTMPLVTAIFVLVFGGLTLWLQDELFIKLKPTVVNGLFAAILFGGLVVGRPLLKPLLDTVLPLDAEGWRKLTWRWAWYFVVLAGLNELVWRSFPTDVWVDFKVFGIMPLTVAFSLAQVPLIRRHALPEAEGGAEW